MPNEQLIACLAELVRTEYAQWMRYVYLSALGYGLDTDQLSEHFQEHASDELEHAATISRWIVDLGGYPPTDMPCVEQFCGTVEEAILWLRESEITGIENYTAVYQLTGEIGLYGLQNDIATILSKEQEHLSDITRLVSQSLLEEPDPIVIVIAERLNRIAVSYKDMMGWLKSRVRDAAEGRPEKPDEAKDIALEVIEAYIMDELWPRRSGPASKHILAEMQKFKEIYSIVKSMTPEQWQYFYDQMFPEEPPAKGAPTFEDIMQEIEEPGEFLDKPELEPTFIKDKKAPKQPAVAPPAAAPSMKMTQAPPSPSEEPEQEPEEELALDELPSRRPEVEQAMATVLHEGTRKPTQVPVGTQLYNQSIAQQKGPGYKQRSVGILARVLPSGDLQVQTGEGTTVWPKDNRIWTSKTS